MSEITKMLAAAGIVAGGFFSASLFGPPEQDLAVNPNATSQQLANWDAPRLEPLDSASFSPQDDQLLPREPAQGGLSSDTDYQRAGLQDRSRNSDSPESWGSPRRWSHTWDQSVAPANHVGSGTGFDGERSVNTTELQENSAPAWPSRRLEPLPTVSPHATGFRGEADAAPIVSPPASLSPPASSSGFDDARFSTLTAPDLMDYDAAQRAQPSRFPERPSQARPLQSQPLNTLPQAEQPTSAPFSGPVLQSPQFDPEPNSAMHNNWQSERPRAWSMSAPLPTPETQSALPRGQATMHIVSDGDSLPKLAERYLQDATRARELYELNKDVLMSPDLLPIGVQIQVPKQASYADRDPGEYEVFDSRGSATRQFVPQRLAPLPEVASDAAPTPRAWLLRPVESTFAGNDN